MITLSGAIFDLDGTLLDSMSVWQDVGINYVRSKGCLPEPDLAPILLGMSLDQAAEYIHTHYAIPRTSAEIAEDINAMVGDFYRNTALAKPGVHAFLAKLQSLHIPMAVATATERSLVEAALKRCGLYDYFKGIFTCHDMGVGKDVPDIYEAALACLGTPKTETMVFEDALYAATTVQRAQFPLTVVYDRFEADHAEALQALTDRYLPAFEPTEEAWRICTQC